MTLQDFLHVLRARWKGIVALTVLGLLAAGLITYNTPRAYTATVPAFVALGVTSEDLGGALTGSQFALQRVTSYTRVVETDEVLQPVIDKLGLTVTPVQLATTVSAVNPVDTVVLEISATDGDPQRAADIANAVAAELAVVVARLEATGTAATSPVKVSILSPAPVPTGPSSPRTRVNLILGLLIGLALGIGYALLRETLDTRIKSADEVALMTGSRPLGQVPHDPDLDNGPATAFDTTSHGAEALRAVRTNLQYVDIDDPPRAITVTSPMPGDGKSSVAASLAIALAQAGRSVVLVDADLRRSLLADYLQIDGSVGLTDVLSGQVDLDEALLAWHRGLLIVLTSGPQPPNPSEMLGSRHMHELVATLRERVDYVIIDAPPLLPVTDGVVLAGVADGAVLVVRHGTTTREQVAGALDALELGGARLLGTIVNDVPITKRRGGRYGYHSYYGAYAGDGPASPPGPDDAPEPVPARTGP